MKFLKKRKHQLILTFKVIASFVIFLGMVVLVIFFFRGDFFRISQVDCEKEELPCTDKEKSYFVEFLGENIFLFNSNKEIKKIKEQLSYAKTITIQKHLPNKISVQIFFRQALSLLNLNGKEWYLIDEDGFILGRVEKKGSSLPEIFFINSNLDPQPGQKLDSHEVNACLLAIKLCQKNFIAIKKLTYLQEATITLDLNEDIIATLSGKKDITLQVDSLQFILRQSKIDGKLPKNIDLRFAKPVVIF